MTKYVIHVIFTRYDYLQGGVISRSQVLPIFHERSTIKLVKHTLKSATISQLQTREDLPGLYLKPKSVRSPGPKSVNVYHTTVQLRVSLH